MGDVAHSLFYVYGRKKELVPILWGPRKGDFHTPHLALGLVFYKRHRLELLKAELNDFTPCVLVELLLGGSWGLPGNVNWPFSILVFCDHIYKPWLELLGLAVK